MNIIKDNSANYPASTTTRNRNDEAYLPFTAVVMSVDYERQVLTIQDDKTQMVFQDVRTFPANASSTESTDVNMPEQGTKCLACKLNVLGGYSEIAILAWITSNLLGAVDAVAARGPEGVEGWTQRRRGTYRKAFPGQKTMTTTSGYSSKMDEGWDHLSSDFSRDKQESFSRQRTQITGRKVSYSDAGLLLEGAINRPPGANAENPDIIPTILPDGSKQYTLFLNSTQPLSSRYIQGTQDILPLTEKTEKIQEFALDYPVPMEVLETDLIDTILGTTQSPYVRTVVFEKNVTANGQTYQVGYDSESYMINQPWDNPQAVGKPAIGPTTNEGVTPARRGFIIEKAEGTFVGSNRFDPLTFGSPLIPVLTPYDYMGRFGANFESGFFPISMASEGTNHVQTRMAASAMSVRFPYEYNTTRWDVTKEGMVLFEIGSSIPEENNPFGGQWEYPHGAGRSVEGHLVGSLKLVVGKNRDEEDAIDLQALGQSVLRFGADDCSLPNANRTVLTQNRTDNDAIEKRGIQYWVSPELAGQGDPVNLEHKQKGENVSIRAASDGGVVFRFGARVETALRRHLSNGYQDPQGTIYVPPPGTPQASSLDTPPVPAGNRIDSKSPGRPTYGAGDSLYQFHSLANAGSPSSPLNLGGASPKNYPSQFVYGWSGTPIQSMDRQGLSIDFHTVRDILIRAGKDKDHGQSLLMDLAGGIVGWIGSDTEGRSCTATLDGGVEMSIGQNKQGNALQLDITGNVNLTVRGNYTLNVTGDYMIESNTYRRTTHTDSVTVAQKIYNMALARIYNETPDPVWNQSGPIHASDVNT